MFKFSKNTGLTLVELLVYVTIVSITAGLLVGILTITTRVETETAAGTEVSAELNFVMQTIQRLTRESSAIIVNNDGNADNDTIPLGNPYSYLALRMKDSAGGVNDRDPVIIWKDVGTQSIKIQQGRSPNQTVSSLTTEKVLADTLTFKKITSYPGHDTVQLEMTLVYNSQAPGGAVSRTLKSAIGRVSAATFDSGLLPGTTNTYDIGTSGTAWKDLYLTGVLNLGTFSSDPSGQNGSLYYNTASSTFRGYQAGSWSNLNFWTASSTNIYFNTGNVGIGTATPSQMLDVNGVIGLQESLIGIDNYTKLLIHSDGVDGSTSTSDSSLFAKAITFAGTAQIDTAQAKFGQSSLLLDGDSDYITVPDSDDWNFGTGDFTVDFWVRFADLSVASYFVNQRVDANNYCSFSRQASGGADSNKLVMFSYFGGGYRGRFDMTNTWSPNLNQWYHLAFVRNGANAYIFIDGVSQPLTQTAAWHASGWGDYASVLYIGTHANIASWLNGWIDEVRVGKGIARWTSNFTVPTKPYGDGVLGRLAVGYDPSLSMGDAGLVVKGNVGIGTTTPSSTLHVVGTTITTATTTLATLGGNVGIGTASPSEKLEIVGGNIKLDGINTIKGLPQPAASGQPLVYPLSSMPAGAGVLPVANLPGIWEKVYENEVSVATTSITISTWDNGESVNGDRDEIYQILIFQRNQYAGNAAIILRPNNDSGANYAYQNSYFQGTGSASSWNTGQTSLPFSGTDNNYIYSWGSALLYAKSGYQRYWLADYSGAWSNVFQRGFYGGYWTNTASNITGLVILSSQTNGIGAGSHIVIFRKSK